MHAVPALVRTDQSLAGLDFSAAALTSSIAGHFSTHPSLSKHADQTRAPIGLAGLERGRTRGTQEVLVLNSAVRCGGVPEWLKGADCKSVGLRLRWFESNLLHQSSSRQTRAKAAALQASRAGVVQW